jgi:hypothetical protein
MEIFGNQKNAKKKQAYECIFCCLKTSNKTDFQRHLLTPKHQKCVFGNGLEIKNRKKPQILVSQNSFSCECGKNYKTNSGLWKHKKQCAILGNSEGQLISATEDKSSSQVNLIDATFLMDIIKQNQEFNKSMLEMFKSHTPSIINNTNSNNKTFNLNFFLNEQCKDALNMSEFVNSIKLQLSDLETTGYLGYVDGISKILIQNLQKLDTYKRPIHCSDIKREILYIKDENKWSKETEEKQRIQMAIKQVADKNIQQIPIWTQSNPEWSNPASKKNDMYFKIVSNSMSGMSPEEQTSNVNKIVKNVTKEILICKDLVGDL